MQDCKFWRSTFETIRSLTQEKRQYVLQHVAFFCFIKIYVYFYIRYLKVKYYLKLNIMKSIERQFKNTYNELYNHVIVNDYSVDSFFEKRQSLNSSARVMKKVHYHFKDDRMSDLRFLDHIKFRENELIAYVAEKRGVDMHDYYEKRKKEISFEFDHFMTYFEKALHRSKFDISSYINYRTHFKEENETILIKTLYRLYRTVTSKNVWNYFFGYNVADDKKLNGLYNEATEKDENYIESHLIFINFLKENKKEIIDIAVNYEATFNCIQSRGSNPFWSLNHDSDKVIHKLTEELDTLNLIDILRDFKASTKAGYHYVEAIKGMLLLVAKEPIMKANKYSKNPETILFDHENTRVSMQGFNNWLLFMLHMDFEVVKIER